MNATNLFSRGLAKKKIQLEHIHTSPFLADGSFFWAMLASWALNWAVYSSLKRGKRIRSFPAHVSYCCRLAASQVIGGTRRGRYKHYELFDMRLTIWTLIFAVCVASQLFAVCGQASSSGSEARRDVARDFNINERGADIQGAIDFISDPKNSAFFITQYTIGVRHNICSPIQRAPEEKLLQSGTSFRSLSQMTYGTHEI